MTFRVDVEQETDGRWIATVVELSGVLAYGVTRSGCMTAWPSTRARRVSAALLRRCACAYRSGLPFGKLQDASNVSGLPEVSGVGCDQRAAGHGERDCVVERVEQMLRKAERQARCP